MQDGLDLVELDVQFGVEGLENLIERLVEITLVVDAVDQRNRYQTVLVGHRRDIQLPQQVALQAFAHRGARGEVPLVVIVAWQAAGAGLVDVFPCGIDGQLVGNAFVPFTFFKVVHGRRGFLIGRFLNVGVGLLFDVVGKRVGMVEVVAFFLPLQHRV